MLQELRQVRGTKYRVVAIDPVEARRDKMKAVFKAINAGIQAESFSVEDISNAREVVNAWTEGIGCNAVLEVSVLCRYSNAVLNLS